MSQEIEIIKLETVISQEYACLRIDQALAKIFPQYSRSIFSQWIKDGSCLCGGHLTKPKTQVKGGEKITICAPQIPKQEYIAQEIDLNIIHEDKAIIVVNKPSNLVVHPGAGNLQGTLLNALLHYCPQLQTLPRAGIVHRLDKDTTGLMVIAKTLTAHNHLVSILQERKVKRQYLALVYGEITMGGRIDLPIGRHPFNRIKMAVTNKGKPAITNYKVKDKFDQFTLLEVNLETGRTHQIRVHLKHIKHPIVGDQLYASNKNIKGSQELKEIIADFKRQALHAQSLAFIHPITKKMVRYNSPIPNDMGELLGNICV